MNDATRLLHLLSAHRTAVTTPGPLASVLIGYTPRVVRRIARCAGLSIGNLCASGRTARRPRSAVPLDRDRAHVEPADIHALRIHLGGVVENLSASCLQREQGGTNARDDERAHEPAASLLGGETLGGDADARGRQHPEHDEPLGRQTEHGLGLLSGGEHGCCGDGEASQQRGEPSSLRRSAADEDRLGECGEHGAELQALADELASAGSGLHRTDAKTQILFESDPLGETLDRRAGARGEQVAEFRAIGGNGVIKAFGPEIGRAADLAAGDQAR